MLFMVIERFKDGEVEAVYRRFENKGRMLPQGLKYIGSWVEANYSRCFQLMESEDPRLFDEWIACWQDLVDFEVIPVLPSEETAKAIARLSDA